MTINLQQILQLNFFLKLLFFYESEMYLLFVWGFFAVPLGSLALR